MDILDCLDSLVALDCPDGLAVPDILNILNGLDGLQSSRIKNAYHGLFFFPDHAEIPVYQKSDIRSMAKGRGQDDLKVKPPQELDATDDTLAVHFGKHFVKDDDPDGVGFFVPAYAVELGKGRKDYDVEGHLGFTAGFLAEGF
jgi:hypothetical protein